jgi:hypothetical protein
MGKNDANVPIIPADKIPNQYENSKDSTLAHLKAPIALLNFFMHILRDVTKYLYPKNIVSIISNIKSIIAIICFTFFYYHC